LRIADIAVIADIARHRKSYFIDVGRTDFKV
jgi:hypothetical protein